MIDAKRKALIFLSLAFVLAIITSVLVLNEIRSAQASLGATTEVAVAAEDIQTYSEITEDMVEWIDIPQAENIPSFITDFNEIQQSVAIVNVQQGELLTQNVLRSSADIPEDHRIVWLNATENVVLDQPVAAGDTIDVVVTYTPEESDLETTRIFENIDVIQREERQEEDSGPPNIKVSLNVNDAEQLIHMQNTASSIRVLLANQVQQLQEDQNEPQEEEEVIEEEDVQDEEEEDEEEEDEEDEDEEDEDDDEEEEEEEDDDE